jgi:molecular chaperone DnaJ
VRRVQQSILGQFVNVITCQTCNGTGELIPNLCKECNGRKQVDRTVTKKVKVPAGVDSDTQIRLTGEGGRG